MTFREILGYVSLFCAAVLTSGCGGNSGRPAEQKPVEQKADLVSHFRGLAKRITDAMDDWGADAVLQDDDGWHRDKDWTADAKFDVEKTSSLVSPYSAQLSFTYHITASKHTSTKKEAESASLSNDFRRIYTLSYALQDRKWVLTQVRSKSAIDGTEYKRPDGWEDLLKEVSSEYPAVVGKID